MTDPRETVTVDVEVNDRAESETVPADMPLAEFLRERLGLTGTHRGCETAKCGACTVLFDGDAVKSCNLLAAQVDGHSVRTVEGIADGSTLHPVQRAFWDLHGLQCGYCTPGFVVTAVAILREDPDPSPDHIRRQLAGNLCRCTGYTKIVESVRAAAERMGDGDE